MITTPRLSPSPSWRRLPSALSLLMAMAISQTTFGAASNADPAEADSDGVVELSPFTVLSANDTAWVAQNTLAGSRMNTELRDTPAVLDVLTRDMLEELGIDDLASALALSANFEVNNGDIGDESQVINSSFPGASKSITFNTRGQGGSLARNYVPTGYRPDFYTIERIDNSSGPNAILFGIGGAGGVANISTKRARLNRDSRSLQFRFDENGSKQVSFDGNQVLVEGKLGARINVISDKRKGHREWSSDKMKGVHIAVKARLTERTEINFEYENAERIDLVVDRRPIRQRLDTWQNAGSNVLTAPVSGNPATPAASTGVTLFGAGPRYVWTLTPEGSYVTNQARSYQPAPGSTGGNTVFNEDQAAFDVNISGPGGRREVNREIKALSIDQRLSEKMYLNLSLSHESGESRSHQTFQNGNAADHSFLSADPNAIIRNVAPATGFYNPDGLVDLAKVNAQGQVLNPFAGRQYVEGRWRRRPDESDEKFAQLTFSWALEAGRWGRHNFVTVLGRSESESDTAEVEQVWEGAPFRKTDVTHPDNRVFLRNYVTPGDWSTYHVGDWMEVENLVYNHPTLGPIRTDWQATSMTSNSTTLENGLIAVQSYFFNNRLVTTFGLRKDQQEVTSRLPYRVAEGPYLGTNGTFRIDGGSATSTLSGKGDSESLGLVFHITNNVSVYYNQSSSFKAGNVGLTGTLSGWMRERGLTMDRPNEIGEGMDYGLKFRFANGKYNIDVGAYDTSSINSSGNLGTNSGGATSMRGYWDAIFNTLNSPFNAPQLISFNSQIGRNDEAAIAALAERYPNLRPNFVHVRDLLDRASNGYEVRFNATPTPNLRLRMTYSFTENEKENILSRTVAETEQLALFLADLKTANPSVNVGSLLLADSMGVVDPSALPIDELYVNLVDLIDRTIDTNVASFGVVPHRINFQAGYDFQGALKGFNLSGGVNWRSASRIGEYVVVDPAEPNVIISRIGKFSNDTTDFSLSMRYRTKMKFFGDKTMASFQINASNLFRSETEIDARRFGSTTVAPGAELPGKGNPTSTFLLDPRTVSASVRFDF